MKRLLILFILSAAVAALCGFAGASKPKQSPAITVFITGNERGTIKPCGCSGAALGGIEKRPSILNSVPKKKRLILDTGNLVKDDSPQELVKFELLLQAFQMLGYDLVNLQQDDLRNAQTLGALSRDALELEFISAGEKSTKSFTLGDKAVEITVVSSEQDVRLFIAVSDSSPADADCIIVSNDGDEPTLISKPGEKPMIITQPALGKYIARIDISLKDGQMQLQFSSVPVIEKMPNEVELVGLYKDYQLLVKELGMLADYPRYILPNSLEYTGSKACKSCHNYEYDKWATKAHADAFATLKKLGSDYDPQCVRCHVVGMEYKSGFAGELENPDLINVGCESCHGPGSKHIKTAGAEKTTQPMYDCADCHTPEHSVDFAGNERQYLEKIVHWK